MVKKILVVCVGNICRSPTAERRLKVLLPNMLIDSAGTGALVGEPADAVASEVALEHGLDLQGHVAKQLSMDMCTDADLILAMEHSHITQISRLSPTSRGKVMLLSHWIDSADIQDPYRRSKEMYEYVFEMITEACKTWKAHLE